MLFRVEKASEWATSATAKTVQINTLEDLENLQKEHGAPLVVDFFYIDYTNKDSEENPVPNITIYDDDYFE